MASPPHRPSGAMSLDSMVARGRNLARRLPVWRIVAALVVATTVMQTVSGAERATRAAHTAWAADQDVWVAIRPIEAGDVIDVDDVASRRAPTALRPTDAATIDPTGERTRTALAAGEIVRVADLAAAGAGRVASLVPAGRHALTVAVAADVHALGDRVGLVAVLDGRLLVDDGVIVAIHPESITVAVAVADVASIVAEFSRGGVEVTLVGQ